MRRYSSEVKERVGSFGKKGEVENCEEKERREERGGGGDECE